ncbi:MAG: hypothetical protein SFY67_16460 [Candidatus Melainabacteria bacterium]|nr:hypothetical protein [Candidatus Melainabacteria bacterium]
MGNNEEERIFDLKIIRAGFSSLAAMITLVVLSGSDFPPCFLNSGQVSKVDKEGVEFTLDWQAHMQRYRSIYKFKKTERRFSLFFSIVKSPSIGKNFVSDQNRKKLAQILEKEKAVKTISLN